MQELLIGRWRAYKFTTNGVETVSDKVAFGFDRDGTVHYAYIFQGKWVTNALKREVIEKEGKTIITENGQDRYEIINASQYELQIAVIENYAPPILIYFMRRVID